MTLSSYWERAIDEQERRMKLQGGHPALLNELDKKQDIPEWEIYTTIKERTKIIMDTYESTRHSFGALLADYLWLYHRDLCDNQMVRLVDFYLLPITELLEWQIYWQPKFKGENNETYAKRKR